jgi:hypothetical protein
MRAHVFAVEPDLARGGPIEAADEIDQRGLAGTGGTHDSQPFAGGYFERDIIQGADDTAAGLGLGG